MKKRTPPSTNCMILRAYKVRLARSVSGALRLRRKFSARNCQKQATACFTYNCERGENASKIQAEKESTKRKEEKNMKKALSLVCCLALALTLTVPAMAAGKTENLYFWTPDRGTDTDPMMTISSDDLVKSTEKYTDSSYKDFGKIYTIPTYESTAPVTVTLKGGYDGSYESSFSTDEDGNPTVNLSVPDFAINSLSLRNGRYTTKKKNPVYPVGKVTYWPEGSGEECLFSQGKTISAAEYIQNFDKIMNESLRPPCFHAGATITVKDPGFYIVYSDYEAMAGVCEAMIIIKGSSDLPFCDVAAKDYCHDAVKWAVDKKITNGISSVDFCPSQTCTRSQILTMLWRANGSPKSSIANPYKDVKSGDFFYAAALWAHEKGLVTGNKLDASVPCTRSETVTYFWKLAGSPAAQASSFTDVDVNAAYAKAVDWAVEKGVTSGTDAATFSPENTCTRGQIVTFLYRALVQK